MTLDAVDVNQLHEFDQIVDVRSPSEFDLDRIPGAINCPVLSDDEREHIGTIHARESAFAAKKAGSILVARNIASHIERLFCDKPRGWRPLIYCWRGGQRSGSMTTVLRQVGWDARKLTGGYKAYRRYVVAEIDRLVPDFSFKVVCGLTGSGKSALLRALGHRYAQVLDLENLAVHRGSVLGNEPGYRQPGQKMFESKIWDALRIFDRSRPVYIEAESRRIGRLRLPDSIVSKMRESPCIFLDADTAVRTRLLLREYAHLTQAPEDLFEKLDCLVVLHGKKRICHWKELALAGSWDALVNELLEDHYDPAYRKSTNTNYTRLSHAQQIRLCHGTEEEIAGLAQELVDKDNSNIKQSSVSENAVS